MGFSGFFINKTQHPTQSPSESGFLPSLQGVTPTGSRLKYRISVRGNARVLSLIFRVLFTLVPKWIQCLVL